MASQIRLINVGWLEEANFISVDGWRGSLEVSILGKVDQSFTGLELSWIDYHFHCIGGVAFCDFKRMPCHIESVT